MDKSKNYLVLLWFLFISLLYGCDFKNSNVHITGYRPEWPDTIPIVMVGNWDGDPLFRNRRGGNPEWYMEEFKREHSEEAIIKLKEMGITMVITDLFKGFGLKAEKDQINITRQFIELCHKNGIMVGVYIGSTIFFETFLQEEPEATDWLVPDYMGRPVLYNSRQPFRKRVYFMHPGYRNYIKKVLRLAIQDLKVDLIHFDNTSERAEAPIFFHKQARKDFRSYLEENYSEDKLKERLGFSNVSKVEPPVFDEPISVIEEPLFQLWTDFRCYQLSKFYDEMEHYIHFLNPQTVVENNPCYGLSGINTEWTCGIYYPSLLSKTSIIWSEEGDEAGYTEDGILISKIRSYKMAVHLKNKIFTYTGESPLQMGEAMVYNRQCLGMVGGVLAGYELIEDRRNIGFDDPYSLGAVTEDFTQRQRKADYIKFFHRNFEFYRQVNNTADFAVLHSYPTLAFNNDRPYESLYLFEQTLLQNRIQFDIIYEEDLSDLSKYRGLILADVECLSERNMDLIREFVKNGGGLVATEHTSLYTEYRNRKKNFGLKDLFLTDAPPWRGRGEPEELLQVPVLKNQIGKGRVVYLPAVLPSVKKPPAEAMRSIYWKLPLNEREIIESVKWAAGGELTIETDAPEFVTMELTSKEKSGIFLLHLLNYRSESSNSEISNIHIRAKLPDIKKVLRIDLLSPDKSTTENISFKETGNLIDFIVPGLVTYNLIVIRTE